MTSDRWRRVTDLYEAVLEKAPPDREVFLRESCADDSRLRDEVESLLSQERHDSPLDHPICVSDTLANERPALAAGTVVGSYRIVGLIGEGGMGQVYRAQDTKLPREVALKILPDAFVHDPDRLARFRQEAHVLASLNHPNIATIYGFEDSGAVHALVLELVEGPTLADRIARGPVPLDEALPIARQIADALEAAHERGIIHRDLKPANVKVREDGTVKVLDFGLAKALEPAATVTGHASLSPTITSPALMTGVGMLLGTAAYMSPEQARGKSADRHSDIWAFGCVLYEMLTGTRPFEGEDVSDTLANVLKTQPDWKRLPATTPASIHRLLRRCLEKNRKQRLSDVADARLELDEAVNPSDVASTPVPPLGRWRRAATYAAIVLVSAAVAGAVTWTLRPGQPVAQETRLEIATPSTTDPISLAVAPDGRKIVFVGSNDDGSSQLWLRSFDSSSIRSLARTGGATFPFWAPNGQSVGFFADRKLKTIDLATGVVQVIADAGGGAGGTWGTDGTILFAPHLNGPIVRVPATGGKPAEVTTLTAGQQGHRGPQLLPDGTHFTFYVRGGSDVRGIYVSGLDGSKPTRIVSGDVAAPVFVSLGNLLFVRQGILFAQPFDTRVLALTGSPVPVSDQVAMTSQNMAAFSAAHLGTIAYRTGSGSPRRQFAWFDRAGRRLADVGDVDDGRPFSPSLSPDGRWLALHRSTDANVDIWLLDTVRGTRNRVTSDDATEISPLWSPDGTRIAFNSFRDGGFKIFVKPLAGGPAQMLPTGHQNAGLTDWSSDGKFLLFDTADGNPTGDLWALPLFGDGRAFPVVQTRFEERDGQFSPDGRFVAYRSDESGRSEIYVQPFLATGRRTQVSTEGGAQVRWSSDGSELFYIALDERLMSVRIRVAADGRSVEAASPVPLFRTHVGGAVQSATEEAYVVSRDGQRFLMNTTTDESSPMTLILNWTPKKQP